MSDRLKLTPEVDSNFPCPVCGATSGCRANREIAFCRGDRRCPKKIGWRRWSREGDFFVWATLSGQDLLKVKPEPTTDQGRKKGEKGEKGEKGDRPASQEKLCKLARDYYALKEIVGDRLRLNELTKEIEFDGKEVSLDDLEIDLAIEFNKSFGQKFPSLAVRVARENAYNPIRTYLEGVAERYGDSTEALDYLAERYFGQSAGIYQTLLRKTLIAAVARIFEPGCKVDTALILQGKQGLNKSSFFKVLASQRWFDDSFERKSSDKDEKLKLHQVWITEWAELASVFKKKDLNEVKAFLSSSTDRIRPPYGRRTEVWKRSGIIVGTTNDEEFLPDPTGNRRFWVIPVRKPIDLAALEQERDRIWAAAVAAYRANEQWWLTGEEEMAAAAVAEEFATSDPWQDAIGNYLDSSGRQSVTVTEILTNCLRVELIRQTRSEQMRVADVLRRLGWARESAQKQPDGKRRQVWVRPNQPEIKAEPKQLEAEPEPKQFKEFKVGDRVTCRRGDGIIARIDRAEALIEGEFFLDWVQIAELNQAPLPIVPIVLNGRAGP